MNFPNIMSKTSFFFSLSYLKEILAECPRLTTLQIGKYIYPAQSEFREIDWSSLKNNLTELAITTKFSGQQILTDDDDDDDDEYGKDYSSVSVDLYSNTIFNYLNESNYLEYLALRDFTIRFPFNSSKSLPDANANDKNNRSLKTTAANLKYLYLRNIRNIKTLSSSQLASLSSFLTVQFNLHTLDIIGLYLSSEFVCSIIQNLNSLK